MAKFRYFYELQLTTSRQERNYKAKMAHLDNPEAKASTSSSDIEGGNSTGHKPLHYTQSMPIIAEERRNEHLQLYEGKRSRSQSEPLSREAVKIAHQLRRASDLFNISYDVPTCRSPTTRSGMSAHSKHRRITVSGYDGESLAQEVRQALTATTNECSPASPLDGTPV